MPDLDQARRLLPFAQRSGITIVGREALLRTRKHLAFLLVTPDLAANSRHKLEEAFAGLPIIEEFSSEEIATLLGYRGCKIVGFRKSTLAQSLLQCLRPSRRERRRNLGADSAQEEQKELPEPQ